MATDPAMSDKDMKAKLKFQIRVAAETYQYD